MSKGFLGSQSFSFHAFALRGTVGFFFPLFSFTFQLEEIFGGV